MAYGVEKIEKRVKDGARGIVKEGEYIETEVRGKVAGYITAAFGLVAGLAWNDAIKSLIEYWFPLDKGSITAKFIYAILITAVLVVVSSYLIRMFKKEN